MTWGPGIGMIEFQLQGGLLSRFLRYIRWYKGYLANWKKYFTNPDFPEIARDFPYFSPPFRVFGRYNLTKWYRIYCIAMKNPNFITHTPPGKLTNVPLIGNTSSKNHHFSRDMLRSQGCIK